MGKGKKRKGWKTLSRTWGSRPIADVFLRDEFESPEEYEAIKALALSFGCSVERAQKMREEAILDFEPMHVGY